MVTPIETAMEDYKNGRVSYEDFLSNLPTALGGSAAAVVGGKVAGDVASGFKKTLTPARPSPTVTPVEPMNSVQRSAAATLRRVRAEGPSSVESAGARDEVVSKIGGESSKVKNAVAPEANQAEIDAAANSATDKFESQVQAKDATLKSNTTGGGSIQKHTISAHNEAGDVIGSLKLTQEADSPITRVDSASSELAPGSGLGTKMYQQAIREAAKRNPDGVFQSDGVVSKPAQGVWRKLKEAGMPVVEQKSTAGSTFSIKLSDLPKPKTVPDWRGMIPTKEIDLTGEYDQSH
jgi:hypothetical protein